MTGLHLRLCLAGTAALIATMAVAQQADNKGSAPPVTEPATAKPFQLVVYGAFWRMMHLQDYSPKVRLSSVMDAGVTEAVGAAAGLRGEITAIGGKLLLSYGASCQACGDPGSDDATLLVGARVTAWHPPIVLPSDLAGQELGTFIIERAKAAGLDTAKPFPLRITGTLLGVKMHVLRGAGSRSHGQGSGHPAADRQDIAAGRTEGEVVGFHAPEPLRGVITHPGEAFHYHWVDLDRTRTTHLDAFGMSKGAVLLLPKP